MTPRIFVECLCGIAVLSSASCGVCRCSFVSFVTCEEGDGGLSWCHF